MGQEQKLQILADTLSKSGLACSPNEALRMAENIFGTEARVAKNFDEKNQRIDDSLTRKRTYQEEVDYLIEKTSPENKEFHNPIKGYRRDSEVQEEPLLKEKFKEVDEVASEPEPAKELVELEVKEIVEEKSELEESSEQVMEAQETQTVSGHQNSEIVLSEKPEDDSFDDEEEELELAPEPEPVKEEIKPVQSDIFDDDRSLKEIMEEDAKKVYSNVAPEAPEPVREQVQEIAPEPVQQAPEPIVAAVEPESVTNLPREKEDDFIGESVAQPEPDQVQSEKPEQMFKEVKEDKPEAAPPKKPIEEVDLMDYFKF